MEDSSSTRTASARSSASCRRTARRGTSTLPKSTLAEYYLDLAIGDRYRMLRTVHPAGQSFAQAGAKEHFVATLTKAATFFDQASS